MGVEMNGLEDAEACWASIKSQSKRLSKRAYRLKGGKRLPHPKHPAYKATGGYLREEAIMVLRRFYITENTNGECSANTLPLPC
jgi:hypothetical protein